MKLFNGSHINVIMTFSFYVYIINMIVNISFFSLCKCKITLPMKLII